MSRKKKYRPTATLAEELEKQAKADAEKQPKRAPLGNLMRDIKREAARTKRAQQKKGDSGEPAGKK